ncbi:MAG: hypothetical protein ACM3US_11790 [Sphingomonadaceae bacterium]
MELWLPFILFLAGFAAALVAGGLLRPNLRGRGKTNLPLDDGVVRLDRLGRSRPGGWQGPEPHGEGGAEQASTHAAGFKVTPLEKRGRERSRPNRRK